MCVANRASKWKRIQYPRVRLFLRLRPFLQAYQLKEDRRKRENKTGFCRRLTVDALYFVTAGARVARGRLNDPQSLTRLTCHLDTGRCRLAHTPETHTQVVCYMTVVYTCTDS